MSKASVVFLASLAAACLACGTAVQSSGGLAGGQSVASAAKVVIVPLPDAVDKGGSTIGGSGGATTSAIRDALVAHGYSPIVGDSRTLADAFVEAGKLGYGYVLKSSLINWEDNATEWSARPDTAGLSLELYDALSKSLVGSSTESIRASAISYTSGTPDRFVPALSDLALSRIFGWRPAPSSANPK